MASSGGVWGIDVGQCGLKAIKLRPADNGQVEVVAFDLIEHPKILSQPDADPDELIKAALEKFASRNEWQKDSFVIGVPGQQTFARFCKLPPVDPKKIPDLVKFEAAQQIPFDMNDVVWDYEVFQAKDSPEVEVGIFAMRKDLIRKHLGYFEGLGVAPMAIQTIPSALYNFCRFDGQGQEKGATVVIDVGAQNTDLIIVEPNSAWSRNIPLGGNAFTEALVKAFKCSFSKAEDVKRKAGDSKAARQIFQAMRPVFADLVAEVQRSLGFYSSTHRDVELTGVLACGNAFRLPGLVKYLETNLTVGATVEKLESFKKVVANETIKAPNFADNLLSFGAAYGLALQGLGLAPISANLLPPELARIAMWKKKSWWFMASAACIGVAALLPWARNTADAAALSTDNEVTRFAAKVVRDAQRYQSEFQAAQSKSGGSREKIAQIFELQKDRALVPQILQFVHDALPEVDPTLASATTKEALEKLVKAAPDRYARHRRGQVLIENLRIQYAPDIDALAVPEGPIGGESAAAAGAPAFGAERSMIAGEMGMRTRGGGGEFTETPTPAGESEGGGAATKPGFLVQFNARVLYGREMSEVASFIEKVFYPRLVQLANEGDGKGNKYPFHIPEEDPKSPDRKNLRVPHPRLNPAANVSQPGAFGRTFGGEGVFGAVPTPPGDKAGATEPAAVDPDPVTGEERKDDWFVTVSFKIRLGEAPPAAADGQAAK